MPIRTEKEVKDALERANLAISELCEYKMTTQNTCEFSAAFQMELICREMIIGWLEETQRSQQAAHGN